MISQKLYHISFLEYLASIWTLRLFNRGCDITTSERALGIADILQLSATEGVRDGEIQTIGTAQIHVVSITDL